MSKVITFLKRIPQEDRASVVGRAWGNFARRQHRLHIEIDRMRQSGCSDTVIQGTVSAYHASANRPQLSLSECRELGIPIDGDVIISLNRPGSKSCP